MFILLHNRQKRYTKLFTLAVFYIGPVDRVHSKMKSRKKEERMGDQRKVLLDPGLSWKSLRNSRIPKIRYFQCYFCLLPTGLKNYNKRQDWFKIDSRTK